MTFPSFSIIIPTRARPEALAACIEALSRLEYPRDRLEVIVVDDGTGSPAAIESIVEPYQGRLSLTALYQDRRGPAAARNLGARTAASDYLAFTDDDCRPRSGWLQAFARHFERFPESIAGGCTENAVTDNACTTASQVLWTYIRAYHLKAGAPFFASNNLALSRAIFERVGGFDERFTLAGGEDRAFCDQCLRLGCSLDPVEDAVVDHHHSLALRRFLRQHYRYGRGAFTYHRARLAQRQGRIKKYPLRFYLSLVGHPFSLKALDHPLRTSLLLFLSQAATVAGYCAQKIKGLSDRHDR